MSIVWMIVLGFSVVLVLALAVGFVGLTERGKRFQQAAKGMGFAYIGSMQVPQAYEPFAIRASGWFHSIKDCISAEFRGVIVSAFDYEYSMYFRSFHAPRKQTVIEFRSSSLNLAGFMIRPNKTKNLPKQFRRRFVMMDDAQFGERYDVFAHEGANANAIQQQINKELRHLLLGWDVAYVIEGNGDRLLIYRPNVEIRPEMLDIEIKLHRRVFKLLVID